MKYASAMIVYLLNSGIYLWLSPGLKDKYPYEFAAWYFGSEGIFTAILLFIACNSKNWFDRQLVYVTAGFIGIRAILYILNYMLILTINARVRMVYLALYSLLIVVPTLISAYRHGHFKN